MQNIYRIQIKMCKNVTKVSLYIFNGPFMLPKVFFLLSFCLLHLFVFISVNQCDTKNVQLYVILSVFFSLGNHLEVSWNLFFVFFYILLPFKTEL